MQGQVAEAVALLEESVALFREIGGALGLAEALPHLGAVVHAQGDRARSHALLREGLRLQQSQEYKRFIPAGLELSAELAVDEGRPEHAVRLCDAAEALREAISALLWPIDRPGYERRVASARAALAPAAFEAAWAAGRALTWKQAIAEALSGDDHGAVSVAGS